MTKPQKRRFDARLKPARAQLDLGVTYADDGAYGTAADHLERAAGHFAEAQRIRFEAMQAATKEVTVQSLNSLGSQTGAQGGNENGK